MNQFTRSLALGFALVLLGCSGPELPFSKNQPAEGSNADIVRPPWEALVRAGPGAENDLDMETLNGPQAQASVPAVQPPLRQSVDEEAPTQAEAAAPDTAKPTAAGGVAVSAVAVPVLQGQGGAELTLAMRNILKEAGWPVVKAPQKNALTIKGAVKLSSPHNGNQTVQLQWVVSTPSGKVLGDIKQQNEVPAGSLDKGWGEDARLAAEGAAEGIFKLIEQFR